MLLIHGFSGSPGELHPLIAALIAAGYSVEAPLLAGHGGAQEQLAATTWRDWLGSACAALDRLRACCRTVVLVGFSMGGALALYMAAHEPWVAGVVTISALIQLDNPLIYLLPPARRLVPYVYPLRMVNVSNPAVLERLRTYLPDLELDPTDRRQIAELRRSVKLSLESVYQLTQLLRQARGRLGWVTAPALLVQARDDEQVPRASADRIFRQIGSTQKTMLRCRTGGHMLPVGPQGPELATRVLAFVVRVAGAPATAAG